MVVIPAPDSLDLLTAAWLPVCSSTGRRTMISPAQLAAPGEDPIVAFAWGRPDFDVASMEFMIGLLTTALGSMFDEDHWMAWWEKPPAPAELTNLFAQLNDAFVLDAPAGTPRFLQDKDLPAEGAGIAIDALLIDQAGAASLFVRSSQITTVSRASAAIALYTLQSWAPAGGRGHRTSLRGGGPFVTLVEPRWRDPSKPMSLWHRLWLNVVPLRDAGARPERRFAWMQPTRTSENGETTTPEDVDSIQALWGMPRRIQLEFQPNVERMACDLTGQVDDVIVRRFWARHGGTNYAGWSQRHPLTPYYRVKATDSEWLPGHPQPRRLCHRDWIGLVISDGSALRAPAACVQAAAERLYDLTEVEREGLLQAAGYDMENMKARGFVEATLPVLAAPRVHAQAVATVARSLIQSSDVAARITKGAVRTALDVDANDKGVVAVAGERVWEATEAPFFQQLRKLVPDEHQDEAVVDRDAKAMLDTWRALLRREAVRIFHELCPLDPARSRAIRSHAEALKRLSQAFAGYGKDGADLFGALGLPLPEAAKKKTKAKREVA